MAIEEIAPAASKQTGAYDNPDGDCQCKNSNMGFISGYPPVGTPEDVGSTLKMRSDAVRQLCREGKLRAIKCGNLWRIPRDWLIEFIVNGGTSGKDSSAY